MTISHPVDHAANTNSGFVFAKLADVSVSVCAPSDWMRDRVEAWVNKAFPGNGDDPYVSVDAASLLGTRGSTPNPCNQVPHRRTHWLLFRGSLVARSGVDLAKRRLTKTNASQNE